MDTLSRYENEADFVIVASPALTTIVDINRLTIYFTTAKQQLGI